MVCHLVHQALVGALIGLGESDLVGSGSHVIRDLRQRDAQTSGLVGRSLRLLTFESLNGILKLLNQPVLSLLSLLSVNLQILDLLIEPLNLQIGVLE